MTRRSAADWFFVPADDARARRPADAAMGIFGALLVTLTALRADQVEWLEDLLGRMVEVLPSWLGTTFQVIYGIGLIYALIIIVVAVSEGRERIMLIRDLALAIGLVLLLTLLLARLVSGAWPVLLPEVFGQAEPLFPVARVALVAAILLGTSAARFSLRPAPSSWRIVPFGHRLPRSRFRRRSRFWLPAVADSVGQPMRFHDLRHSHVALLIALGAHPAVIASRLGHISVKTVLDVYGHLYGGLDRNAADTLNPPWDRSDVDAMWTRRIQRGNQGRGPT